MNNLFNHNLISKKHQSLISKNSSCKGNYSLQIQIQELLGSLKLSYLNKTLLEIILKHNHLVKAEI